MTGAMVAVLIQAPPISAQAGKRAKVRARAAAIARAESTITGAAMLRDIATLASDRFQGRAPGTPGEDSAVAYIEGELRRAGLRPGNSDGSWVQKVPLVGTTSAVESRVIVRGRSEALRPLDDIVAWSLRPDTLVTTPASEIVFVGYGVVAPEYGWDDFKGADVRGKTVIMLVGDPPVPDPRDSTQLDSTMFGGRAMTYYGRWTYKFETAAARGAAAVLLVHQTGPAGYPWTTVQSNAHEKFEVAGGEPAPQGRRQASLSGDHAKVEGWIHVDATRRLFNAASINFDQLQWLAKTRAFRPVRLPGTAAFTVRNAVRRIQSRNVVGRLDGSDPRLKREYVVLSAHWDAYGIGRAINGDSIYNGALDDASGVAWLLAQARAFKAMKPAPRRTLVFLAVTAEEQGLLGSRWYGQHPVYPLAATVANVNMDAMNLFGPTRAIVSLGYGRSTLERVLAAQAARTGRVVRPDPEPEKGYFYRADHFEFARRGVPALSFLFPGTEYLDKPEGYEARVRGEYIARDYHKPSDDVKSSWDLAGMVDDTRLLFRTTLHVADAAARPAWTKDSEFKRPRP